MNQTYVILSLIALFIVGPLAGLVLRVALNRTFGKRGGRHE